MHDGASPAAEFADLAAALPDYITPSQIARRLPSNRDGKAVHVSTVIRYMTQGVVGRDGSRLKLRAVRLPGGWRSTWAWVNEFIEAITLDRTGAEAPARAPAPPPPGSRRSIDEAERYLAASGF